MNAIQISAIAFVFAYSAAVLIALFGHWYGWWEELRRMVKE